MTLPRQPRRHGAQISVAGTRQEPGAQEVRLRQEQGAQEVRLAPYFDGVGPRTSANGSMETQQQGSMQLHCKSLYFVKY